MSSTGIFRRCISSMKIGVANKILVKVGRKLVKIQKSNTKVSKSSIKNATN